MNHYGGNTPTVTVLQKKPTQNWNTFVAITADVLCCDGKPFEKLH